MDSLEYLVRHSLTGSFGRFRADHPMTLPRGASVVIRTDRGLELGEVIRPATARHAAHLGEDVAGQLLRQASPEDQTQALQCRTRAGELLLRAGECVREMKLPVEILDAEVLLDGEHAAILCVRWGEADIPAMGQSLTQTLALKLDWIEIGAPAETGCGDCGSGGGCGSCGTGGGCGSSCGTVSPAEVQAYFAGLREKMEKQQRRVPLL
jgi:hypothetical protein